MKRENLKVDNIPSYACITSRKPEFATKEGFLINKMRSGSVRIYFERRDGTKNTAIVSSLKHYNEEVLRFVRIVNHDFEK